ncbi:hypothetical protein [Halogranum amylolyticum]|uniref:hypothetical protein n=1 Tax=Halogranum amylolyticum TaxID=660520 RepID=UPI000A9A4C0B|nr:hypothetical protein [Halogranum amylolyticum]
MGLTDCFCSPREEPVRGSSRLLRDFLDDDFRADHLALAGTFVVYFAVRMGAVG